MVTIYFVGICIICTSLCIKIVARHASGIRIRSDNSSIVAVFVRTITKSKTLTMIEVIRKPVRSTRGDEFIKGS
jgi:hypothetical protein